MQLVYKQLESLQFAVPGVFNDQRDKQLFSCLRILTGHAEIIPDLNAFRVASILQMHGERDRIGADRQDDIFPACSAAGSEGEGDG